MEVKVSIPSTRAAAIAIYASLLANVDWALGLAAQYQQPRGVAQSGKFRTYLANAAAAPLSQNPPLADFAEFRSRVRACMTADEVDPDHPDRLTRKPIRSHARAPARERSIAIWPTWCEMCSQT